MKALPVWSYIYLGTVLRFLQDASTSYRAHGDGSTLHQIDRFLSDIEKYGLSVTNRASVPLKILRPEVESLEKDKFISAELAKKIGEAATQIRHTLVAEARGSIAYIASDKRYSVEKLTENMWELFRPGVRDVVDDVAIYDIEEAGKCIAFERPTAAAFHMMRATEAVLKTYYCAIVKRNRATLMWGPMVLSLRKRRAPPPAALLDHLDSIRRNFRNPTQHPDKIYDLQETQDLLGICIDVINRMVAELPAPDAVE